MTDLNLKTFNKLYPMMIRKYSDLIIDQNASEKDKINSVILKLNALGKLSNDVVRDWNTVYQWAMNDGLTTDVNNKIEDMYAKGKFDTILNTVVTKMGDLTTLTTPQKDTIVHSINSLQSEVTTNTTQLADIAINVKSLGAKGDGITDDSSAFKSAIDFLKNQSFGYKQGGTIFLPAGTYLLGTITGDMCSLLNWYSNINLIGVGEKSVLKVKGGLNALGKYFNVIATNTRTSADAVSNCIFRDFVIDENGVNNLIPNGEYTKENNGIQLLYGDNIICENVTVRNNPGLQCLRFGADVVNGFGTVIVKNCKIEDVGTSVPNNIYQIDHSSIYYTGSKIIIDGNIFKNSQRGVNAATCAIEVHAESLLITNNLIDQFNIGIIIAADTRDIDKNLYINNIIKNATVPIQFWSSANFNIKNTIIKGNILEIPYGEGFGIHCENMQTPADEINISDNKIICTAGISANTGVGISIKQFKKIAIRNNKIEGFLSDGLAVTPIDTLTTLTVNGNEIIDCGRSTTIGDNYGISLLTTNKFKSFDIQSNTIKNTNTQYMKRGIVIKSNIGKGIIDNNNIDNIPDAIAGLSGDIVVLGTVSERLYINHKGRYSPESFIPACVGSKWEDTLNHIFYTKKGGNNENYAWKGNQYQSSVIDGKYELGDMIENTFMPANNIVGWVCMQEGTKGTISGITATTTAGSNTITVNDSSALRFGDFIAIAGASGHYKVQNINGTSVTLFTNVNVTLSNAAVSYFAPVHSSYATVV